MKKIQRRDTCAAQVRQKAVIHFSVLQHQKTWTKLSKHGQNVLLKQKIHSHHYGYILYLLTILG